MSTDNAPKSLPIGYIEIRFLDGLLAFAKCLGDANVKWALGGDLADAIRGVDVNPEHAEISTDAQGAAKIHEAVRKYNPGELKLLEQRLPRDAEVDGKAYPVYVRSHFFEVTIEKAPLQVHGDLQYKVGEWPWGDVLEFDPEPVNLVGTMIDIVPNTLRLELYRNLGWSDKVKAINEATMKGQHAGPNYPGLD